MPSAILHGTASSNLEAVQEITDRMKTVLEEAQTNMSHEQRRASEQANKSRRDEVFAAGDEVVLSTRHLNVDPHLPTKLRRRWVGPFTIAAVISPVAYRLELPPHWKIHPVFHVSNLKRYVQSAEFPRVEQPPPPIMVER